MKPSIKELSLTDSNYDSAVEVLNQRFGKPQQIVRNKDELLKLTNCEVEPRELSEGVKAGEHRNLKLPRNSPLTEKSLYLLKKVTK